MAVLISVTLFLPCVKADIQLSQEFVEPVKNWSFEEIGNSVCECPPWTSNNGGWRDPRSDVNGDGKVTSSDILYLQIVVTKIVKGILTHEEALAQYPQCDVTGNGKINTSDILQVQIDVTKMAKGLYTIHRLDGKYSWYTNGGGDYEMWQWLDSDAIEATAGQTVVFSFWFYPESVALDGSQNTARAEIYYEYSGGSNTVYGVWIGPTELNWWNVYVTADLPSTTTAVKVIINGKPDFKVWIDLAQLTTTAPDTSTANPYSTEYEFVVPSDGDAQVTYHHEVEVYVWSEWNWRDFWFKAIEVDDWVLNVKIDGTLRYSGSTSDALKCQPVSVDLGPLSAGYHTLEFDFVEQWSGGKVKFCVALFGDPNLGKAALTRFHVDVPDYGDSEVRYKVKTTTYFSINDDYFLNGFADDFIDDLYVNGLKWMDWEWGDIYAWGDGFCYPLGTYDKDWETIQFDYGEIWGGGSLDFEFISWTNQRDKIGPPKFYAVGKAEHAWLVPPDPEYPGIPSDVVIEDARFYGGSKWKFADTPEFSERYFETRLRINASYSSGSSYFNTRVEVGVGLGWAEWALGPGTMDDLGVLLNFTCLAFDTNMKNPSWWWDLYLSSITLDIYSCPYVELEGVEHYPTGESIVNPDSTIAVDYTGTVIMFVAGILQPEIGLTTATIGALVGLAIKGIAAGTKYVQAQKTYPYTIETQTVSHYGLKYKKSMYIYAPDKYLGSKNDLVFFKLDPVAGMHCGLTKVVLRGSIMAYYCTSGLIESHPIADVELTLCIPWFVRG